MYWIQMLLIILVITFVSLFIFNAVKKHILPKYNIKRGYLLILIFIFLLVPSFVLGMISDKTLQFILQLVQMLCVSVIFLTYMEIKRIETEKKNRPVVGRPKQKPNRVKSEQEK